MKEFIKNLKLKLLIIFTIPAIGMLYFSSAYLKDKVIQYSNTKYLDNISKYIYTCNELIGALQKERGASIAYISNQSDFFKKKLINEREKTDKNYLKLKQYLLIDNNTQSKSYLKQVIEGYSNIAEFRKKVDSRKVKLFCILNYYSKIISNLITSTDILKNKFVNERFFQTIVAYRRIIMLAEVSGQERALISYLLGLDKKKDIKRIIYKLVELEMKFKQVRDDFISDATVSIYTRYRDNIHKEFEEKLIKTKHDVIFNHNFHVMSSEEWWSLTTKYIDILHEINSKLLNIMMKMKTELEYDAQKALFISMFLWGILIIALFFLIKTIEKIVDTFGKLVSNIDEQKILYRTYADFSEALFYNDDNENTIFTSLLMILEHTGFFKYIWLIKKDSNTLIPVITENFPISTLKKELSEYPDTVKLKIFDDIYKVFYDARPLISYPERIITPIYRGVELFSIYPVLKKDSVEYAIVAAFNDDDIYDSNVNDILLRLSGNLTYAFEKIAYKERERNLLAELRVAATAFNAYEAIIVTDRDGNIIKANKAFTKITGYTEDEVIGKSPNILKSGKHDKAFYTRMWDKLRKEGYWRGEIFNKRKNGEIYPELLSITAVKDENGKVINYVAHFFDITTIKEAQEKAEYRALHDPLTNLLNRQGLSEELEIIYNYSNAYKEYNAFLFFDMDNFKYINDYYGHEMGDKLLQITANKLKKSIENKDVVARIAGDEFGIILTGLGTYKKAATAKASLFAENLLNSFKNPIIIDDIYIELSFSIGIKIFPDNDKSPQDIITNADIAMYQAKKDGKNRFHFFDSDLDRESKRYLEAKNKLTATLNKRSDEIKLYYQPKVSVVTGKITGFEALVRWQQPDGTILSPDEFLFATVGNTLSLNLNRYIIKKVCEQIVEWKKLYPSFNRRVSINISGEQFSNKNFESELLSIVKSTDADPHMIDLEIVEDALLKDTEKAISSINRLKKSGFTFSIDDFGTGYSSLNYLYKLPVDTLKIDKSFVMNIFRGKNASIVKMVIETAKLFGMKTVAEGVEDVAILNYLESYGCDEYQGYLYSKPLPPDEAEVLISKEFGNKK